jgi:hypothetical protein
MARSIPCFICAKLVELHNEDAIAALCEEHKTEENLETLSNTPVHKLQNILNQNMEKDIVGNNQVLLDRINELESNLEALKENIDDLEENTDQVIREKVEQVKPTTKPKGKVNDYGEFI